MDSVVDYIDCPRCDSEAHNEFFYKTGEEHITCIYCGYSRKFYIVNWEDRGKESEFEWVPEFKLEEVQGCGAYRIRYKSTLAYECSAFASPEARKEFCRLVRERGDELAHAEYHVFEGGVLTKTILIQED
jgi:hypothetical protein